MLLRLRQFLRASGCATMLLFGCSKQPDPPQPVASVPQAESPHAAFESTLPQVGGPDGYVGSSACRSCHEDQFKSWHRSYHRTMTQVASEESVHADFNNVVLTTEIARFTLSKREGEFWVRMEPLVRPSTETEPPPALEQRIGLVTGSHHMQVFWVPAGDGNLQLGFPFTWLIPEKRWVPRNSTFVRPPDLPHNAELWNIVCSRCHTTGVEPHLDLRARTAHTRVAELGISCEACHGPGKLHVQTQQTSTAVEKSVAPGEIVHPKELSAERSSQVCGFCHSMKWMDKSSTWRQTGFEFRPGDDLEKTTPVIRPSRIDAIAGLKDYLAQNPSLLDDFFWPDGMVRVSGREYNGLLESPCYKGGKFSCLSCHSLHESDPNDQLASRGKDNAACLQCHDKFRDSTELIAHTHHRESSSGSQCYNCHMPHTTYGILKAIRSHQISSPNVATDTAAGRPNACNLCHIDQPLSWTASHLAAWYRHSNTNNPAPIPDVPHLVRTALSGDAGQRVLAAWHLSWTPALEASKTNWIVPVLGQLLDDPYAAVRCVAERSLKQIGAVLPDGYDYAVDPKVRPPVRDLVWELWERNNGSPARGPQVRRELFETLLRERNDRYVRLRE